MPNKNWPRWIFASFSVWFAAHRSGLEMYTDGDDPATSALADYFEFRTNGPTMTEFSRGWWKIGVVINCLLVSKRNDRSIYQLPTDVGIIAAAFQTNVPVYKFGDGQDDDRTQLLGCMVLTAPIEITYLGQVDPNIKEWQAMVQGDYRMHIEVTDGTA